MQPDEDQRRDGSARESAPDSGAPQQPADPQAGIDREVGDLEDPDAEEDGALPGRVGGGLAGG